jgi:flavin-dependent dehydrogenase
MRRHHDVVIAGASFAGLAVAREVPGRAILIDPEGIGEGVTSACGAPLRLLQTVGAGASVQQVHGHLMMHTPGREIRWPLPEPFCTFDYGACCRAVFAATEADVLKATVQGRDASAAVTSAGEVGGRVLVDCTGWRAALAGTDLRDGMRTGSAARTVDGGPVRYFGLEAEVPGDFSPGLHFYFWPEFTRDGYGWAFPAGRATRIGLLSYRARSRLGDALTQFLRRLGMPDGPRHGGFLGGGLHPPVADGIFKVGDAAGQCLPFTGEGIRTAVWAGRVCGQLIRQALRGEIGLDDARARYGMFVARQRRRYRALIWATSLALVLPARILGVLAAWAAQPGPLRVFMDHYLGMFAPETSEP